MFNLNKKIALVAILALTLGLGALGVSAGIAVPTASVIGSAGNYQVVIDWNDGVNTSASVSYPNEPVITDFVDNLDGSATVTFTVDTDTYIATATLGTASLVETIVPATLSSIAITTPATKLSYTVGDALDITGLVVTGTYSDGNEKIETIDTSNITGFDSSVAVTGQVLTITVGSTTASYTVDIAAVATPTLSTIAITTPANKLSYKVGDTLDITGLVVTGTYSDGSTSTEAITTGNITGFNSSAAVTSQVLTITVNGKTATYTINVLSNSNSGGGGMGYIVGGLGGGTVVGTTTGQVLGASTFIFRTTLKFGSRGAEVKALQDYLKAQGFFTYPVSTGYFGPITLQALKNYQKAMLLKVTGMTDLTTRNILNLSATDHQKYLGLLIEYLKLQIEIAKLSV